ncbi:hypothetical protein H0H93_004520 [Arthromyces matolae]|nr:hypothetical protein H0H93_004520 [Arthromyces matolae]
MSTAELLSQLIAEETRIGDVGLHTLAKLPSWQESAAVKECTLPKTWRLMESEADGKPTDEELVFTVYGELTDHNLPPFNKSTLNVRDKTRLKYIKQSVEIDGLKTLEYENARNAMRSIHAMFDRAFKEGVLEDLSDGTDRDTISAANRLLTPLRDAPTTEAHIPHDNYSDPDGALESLVCQGFKRTEDNIVNYIMKKRGYDGKYRYRKIKPQTFRKGDLVAIQVSFVVVPLRGGKARMNTVLRSITLLREGTDRHAKGSVADEAKEKFTVKRKVRTGEDTDESEVEGLPKKIWRGMIAMEIAESQG